MKNKVKRFLIMCFGLSVSMFYIVCTYSSERVKLGDRELIYNELSEQNVLEKERKLVHFAHVCNLIIDNALYPVINLIEHVPGAKVPRGVARLLVLDSNLMLAKEISHDGSSKPLFCENDQLFLHGFLAIDGLEPEGNVLTFSDKAQNVIVTNIEANDFPKQVTIQ